MTSEEEDYERPAKRHYSSTDIPADVRNVLAKVYKELLNDNFSRDSAMEFISRVGYDVPRATMYGWVSNLESRGVAVEGNAGIGRPPLLDEQQKRLLLGYVLDCNFTGTKVALSTGKEFIHNFFNVEASEPTVCNLFNELGLSCRSAKTRTIGYHFNVDELVEEAYRWLCEKRGGCSGDPVCSFDFTYTGHRTDKARTFSLRGGDQPSSAREISIFTNVIATNIWSDGVNRTPSVLFTYNPHFRFDAPLPKRDGVRKAQILERREYLLKTLREFNIDKSRIIYVGELKGEKRTYVSEDPSLVEKFFALYPSIKKTKIFSDNGKKMNSGDGKVFEKVGFPEHVCYTANTHHILSTNDNHLHGDAKTSWRSIGLDYKDDVRSCIALLAELDRASAQAKLYFERNLQIGRIRPNRDLVKTLFENGKEAMAASLRECLYLYRLAAGKDGRGGQGLTPPQLRDHLDGIYWML